MEHLRSRKWVVPVSIVGGIALGAAAVVGVRAAQGPSAAERATHAYGQEYTDVGKCLHGTPYDPANGAFINVNHDPRSGEDILSDVPLAANAYGPSVLFLDVHQGEQFTPGDHNTAAFLLKAACPDISQGS